MRDEQTLIVESIEWGSNPAGIAIGIDEEIYVLKEIQIVHLIKSKMFNQFYNTANFGKDEVLIEDFYVLFKPATVKLLSSFELWILM